MPYLRATPVVIFGHIPMSSDTNKSSTKTSSYHDLNLTVEVVMFPLLNILTSLLLLKCRILLHDFVPRLVTSSQVTNDLWKILHLRQTSNNNKAFIIKKGNNFSCNANDHKFKTSNVFRSIQNLNSLA